MNLPADDRIGQGAESADAPAAESGGADSDSTDAAGAVTRAGEVAVDAATDEAGAARAAAARRTRRILDEVFGDVLPTVTRDELDDGTDRSSGGRDQWYRDNRPPHHD